MIARDHDAISRGAAVRHVILPVLFSVFGAAYIDLTIAAVSMVGLAGAACAYRVIISGAAGNPWCR